MFELLVLIIFIWLSAGAVRLALRVTWGLAKAAAMVLCLLALPAMVGCLLLAGGVVLLLPLVLVGAACMILSCCT